jgi:hypothetical protein
MRRLPTPERFERVGRGVGVIYSHQMVDVEYLELLRDEASVDGELACIVAADESAVVVSGLSSGVALKNKKGKKKCIC